MENLGVRRPVVGSIAWLDVWRRLVNSPQTALMPYPWDVSDLVKFVASMINPGVRHRADAIRKVELLRLQGIVEAPLRVKALQLWAGCDADSSALGELYLIWPSSLAHGVCLRLTRTR